MELVINIVIALAMLAVLASLFAGFYTVMRGGEFARANSNKFMRYRVATQAVAIVAIAIGCFYKLSH
jgi:Hypoxia induced protein conserved region